MTKTGKSSAYWNDVCHRYAQSTFQFSTGKRPGRRKLIACPLQKGNKVDLFGRHIVCTYGFHKSTDKAGPNAVAGGSSEEAGTSQGEQGVKCSLCGVVAEAEKFSEHLSDYHAEERCDTCGARVQGAVGLLQHIESNHYGALLAPRASTSKNPSPSPCPSPSPRLAPPPQHLPSPLPAPVSPSPCHSPALQPSPPPLRPTPSLWPSPSPRPTPFLQPSPSPCHSPASQPSPPWPTPSPRPTPSPWPTPSSRPSPSPHHSPAPQPLPPPRPTPSSRPSPSPHHSPAPQPLTLPRPTPSSRPSPSPCHSPAPQPTPSSRPAPSLPTPPLPQAATDWESFLPSQFKRVLQPADWVWIAKCLYEPTGQLRQKIQENWFYPPMLPKPSPPEPGWYFR
ncbi:protein TsetseEP-like [Megalobrama amblycephala]|uniref:protein TsetseEP-like n=1 Tax=Megalobrama amblycephala TaxID=75352 RepID=UPI002013D301|nr:protein TsetseEP-like [Megalobrama amblycephala]